jgi:hypothetical protein
MKSLTKILASAIIAGSFLFAGCNFDTKYIPKDNPPVSSQYKPGKVSTTTLGKNYQRPGGLSLSKGTNSKSKSVLMAKDSSGQNEIYFTVNPTFDPEDNFFDYPAIYNLNNASDPVYTFPSADAKEFAISLGSGVNSMGQGCLIPSGLSIETLVLPDTSILVISNISGKLYRIVKNLDTGKFQNDDLFSINSDELFGTTNIALEKADSNIIYLTQIPLYKRSDEDPNRYVIDRPKRIISLSFNDLLAGLVNPVTKFALPITDDVKTLNSIAGILNNEKYAGDFVQFGDFLNMSEDSSGNFWFADSLDRRIYSQDGSVFKELDRPPTSITVDAEGNLFIIKGTLLNSDKSVASPPELVMISPDGTETNHLSDFIPNFDFSSSGSLELIPIVGNDGEIINYFFPEQEFSSLSSSETDTTTSIYYANYLEGTIQQIDITKESMATSTTTTSTNLTRR